MAKYNVFQTVSFGFVAVISCSALAAQAQSTSPSTKSACKLENGVYQLQGQTYKVEVTQGKDKLTLKEANKTSVYQHVGNCEYSFTNPTNGITYMAKPENGALLAYKPGEPLSSASRLVLINQKPTGGKCKGLPLTVENPEALHSGQVALYGLSRAETAQYAGTYKSKDANAPRTILNADGSGVFEVYGAPDPRYVFKIESWYIQANCDGTPIYTDHEAAKAYFIVFKVDRPYQGNQWLRNNFVISKSNQGIFHLDRAKQP